jgi:hypothetical protein
MRIVRILVFLACALVAWSAHAQAPSPGKDVAKKLFDEGVDLEKKNDFAGALAKYNEAEQITVTAGLHFHLAFCLEQTNKLAAALDAYEVALKLARDTSKADVEKAVLARLEPLRTRVPFLAVKTNVTDASVQLDGTSLASVLLDGKPFRVDPGEHTIVARAPGYTTFTKKVQIAAGATTNVDIALTRESAAAPAPVPVPAPHEDTHDVAEPPPEAPKSGSKAVPIALAAGAVALIAGGVVFYVVADNAQSDAQTDCLTKTACDTPRSKVRTFDALALGSFVGAAGLGVLAIITWPSARVVASPTSVRFEGRF